MSSAELLALFYRAATCRIGLRVETSDPAKLRAKLYAARKDDPSLGTFQLRLDPDGLAVWIVPQHSPESADAPST